MTIEGNHTSGAAYFRFPEEVDPDMVQVQVDTGKAKGLASVKAWILTNWRLILGIIIALILLGIGIIIGHAIVGNPIRSKAVTCTCHLNNSASPPERDQLNVTQLFQSSIRVDKLKEYFGRFTAGPHYAGSSGSKELAAYIQDEWKSYGFNVHTKSYSVLLSRPNIDNPNVVEVFDTTTGTFVNNMRFTPSDFGNSELPEGMLPPFNPYSSADASLQGAPFFVNFGRLEDFKFIKDNMRVSTMNAKGKICVARMGTIPLFRLVANCEAEGGIGVVAFPDPGMYAQGEKVDQDVYPKTWWLPHHGTIRDTARSTYGDPGSFFYPALDDSGSSADWKVLKGDGMPKIPVQVISYDDAREILRNMKSPLAPETFHANASVHKWYMGPGFHNKPDWTFRMGIDNNVTSEVITNVIGVIKGSVEPDRYVIVGNHRDSLAYGGVEPGTGSACLMELARALGKLKKEQGWKPRRTIILASWDAGEEGHIGSTEWVEEHLEILHERAIAYINLDEAVSGTHTFTAEGSPLLAEVLYQATQKIDCPDKQHTNMRIYENWSQKRPISDTNTKPKLDPPGTTSDLTPFLHLAGVPSVDLRYTYNENTANVPAYPLMHTGYDTADYVMSLVDEDFSIHGAVTKVAGEVVLELVDAILLPVRVDDYADELLRYARDLNDQYNFNLDSLIAAAREFDRAAEKFQQVVDLVNVSMPFELRDVNDQLMAVEKAFLGYGGSTLQEQQLRHVVYGPSIAHPYKGVAFPMLANTLFAANVTQDYSEVRRHLPHMATMVRVAAKVLDDTTTL